VSLSDHARAARILGEKLAHSARQAKDDAAREVAAGKASIAESLVTAGLTLWGMAEAHLAAATAMEEAMRKEMLNHGCTIDHAALTAPKCPACGAPRTAQ
jgi:hypothetical protein